MDASDDSAAAVVRRSLFRAQSNESRTAPVFTLGLKRQAHRRPASDTLFGTTKCYGFTLIELIVVLTILALLIGIILPNVIGQVGTSRSKAARIQIEELGAALDTMRLETGRYPSTDEGLETLVKNPATLSGWRGPYLKKPALPADPWGNPYRYRSPGRYSGYDLYSLGRDNKPGGTDEDSDVNSWQ